LVIMLITQLFNLQEARLTSWCLMI